MRTAGIASLSFESDTVGEAADLAAYKGTVVSRLLALSHTVKP